MREIQGMFSMPTRLLLLAVWSVCAPLLAQETPDGSRGEDPPRITTPKEQLGHNLGDDYFLANYAQLVEYWHLLDRESERLQVVSIGKTEEGREMLMAIVTSPDNHQNLERYREISVKLAHARGLNDRQARELAAEGKAVVWIDGGLHASEVLVAQQLMEMVYQLVSGNDPETLRFLEDCVVLLCNPNPDGQDLVANWYMRHEDPKQRSSRGLPRLYQKYTGHDNNRDFYMVTQKESEAICRIFYHQWCPQIVYNHHQTGPAGTVLFAPPFRGPFNHNFDPLVPLGIDLVGAAMHSRFAVEGKPGATMRRGASYSTWWNGGLRTNVYFHNMIGLLTETIGHPTPMEIPLRLSRQLATEDLPYPITPQKWHFRQSVEYSITANRAVLDVASRNREHFLYNAYRMGRNSIERGSRDHWTHRPRMLERAQEVEQKGGDAFKEVLRDPAQRDPRGYILSADQADFLTATKFINTLIKNGVICHRATAFFEVAGKTYPEGSFVVKTAQAYRPHVLDMFEPQDHPDDFPYPGGPPIPPYDSAGWTLAYQMGVQFDRILDGFDGPFAEIEGFAKPLGGGVAKADGAQVFVLSHEYNDAFILMNRLLRAGEAVSWTQESFSGNGRTYPPGTILVRNGGSTLSRIQPIAEELGLPLETLEAMPAVPHLPLKQVRIGLWDRYGGSMDAGWCRWILEKFEFDFRQVFPQELDAGNLNEKFDVLIFVKGGISARSSGRRGSVDESTIPEEYRAWLGSVSAERTIPQLETFLKQGGTILTLASSTSLAEQLGLPLEDPLVEFGSDGTSQRLGREKYYVPGSVLRVRTNTTHPIAYGQPEVHDVYFNNSPIFRLTPDAMLGGIKPIAWFTEDKPLRSGWAWGQHYLKGNAAIVEAPVGKGLLYLFGPEITFRAQPHGTFKYLFNSILYGPARVTANAATAARQDEP